ncbi:unnamed protein product [Danaus chrysippus]|uniref:(African queen) hypothetical protein n=1 Tax=Danaus chrysippus TaxID=151541 RepID=A0A8J2WA43_9NEOP|nr:unnamed protein product [Danaus chrysippus]
MSYVTDVLRHNDAVRYEAEVTLTGRDGALHLRDVEGKFREGEGRGAASGPAGDVTSHVHRDIHIHDNE